MEIPEGRSWYFPGQGWLGLALRDEEREEGRGEHPPFRGGSTELPMLTSIGWLVGMLIESFSGSCVPRKWAPQGTVYFSGGRRLTGPPLPILLQLDEFRYNSRLEPQGCGQRAKGHRVSFLLSSAGRPITRLP